MNSAAKARYQMMAAAFLWSLGGVLIKLVVLFIGETPGIWKIIDGIFVVVGVTGRYVCHAKFLTTND